MNKRFFFTMLFFACFYAAVYGGDDDFVDEETLEYYKILESHYDHPLIHSNECGIKIISPKNVYAPGEKIPLDVMVSNQSSTTKQILCGLGASLRFTINCPQEPQYKQVPLKAHPGYTVIRNGNRSTLRSGSTIHHVIKPGETFCETSVILNNHYDMTLGGTYIVQVEKWCEIDRKYSASKELRIVVNSKQLDVFAQDFPKKWSEPQNGVSFSLLTDKSRYENYEPVYVQIAVKNTSAESLSMPIDAANVFDVYELTLLAPGESGDFSKPRSGEKSERAELTLYGKKLLSEKGKAKKSIVKPNEVAAETVVVLNQIFDMSTLDGIYGLKVSRKVMDSAGKEQTITSDPLPIRVGTAWTDDEQAVWNRERIEREDVEIDGLRKWQSKDGFFKAIATFVSTKNGNVTIEKEDGKRVTIELSILRKEDNVYVKQQMEKKSRD